MEELDMLEDGMDLEDDVSDEEVEIEESNGGAEN